MQGVKTINLYYEIDDITIKEYMKEYGAKSTKILIDDNTTFDDNSSIRLENIKLNENYVIYVLVDTDNELSFVAIDGVENKCIFVYQRW